MKFTLKVNKIMILDEGVKVQLRRGRSTIARDSTFTKILFIF